jgi:hypothetical protein
VLGALSEDEEHGLRETKRDRASLDERRLVDPLPRGFDGGRKELRRSPQRTHLLDRSLRIQSQLQDHDRLQALSASVLGISGLDEADPLGTRDRSPDRKGLLRSLRQAEKRQKGNKPD